MDEPRQQHLTAHEISAARDQQSIDEQRQQQTCTASTVSKCDMAQDPPSTSGSEAGGQDRAISTPPGSHGSRMSIDFAEILAISKNSAIPEQTRSDEAANLRGSSSKRRRRKRVTAECSTTQGNSHRRPVTDSLDVSSGIGDERETTTTDVLHGASVVPPISDSRSFQPDVDANVYTTYLQTRSHASMSALNEKRFGRIEYLFDGSCKSRV